MRVVAAVAVREQQAFLAVALQGTTLVAAATESNPQSLAQRLIMLVVVVLQCEETGNMVLHTLKA
jgi:hypothetical protein